MTALTERERKEVGDEINTLERHGGEEAKMNLIYGWVKSGKITRRQHGLLCRMVLTDQTPEPAAWVAPPKPHLIVVTKDGAEVFRTERGDRPEDYPLRDYTCFGSPIIGAAYHYLSWDDIAKRIKERGYETKFTYATVVEG